MHVRMPRQSAALPAVIKHPRRDSIPATFTACNRPHQAPGETAMARRKRR